jgi:pyochelin biosynthesis protein PchC
MPPPPTEDQQLWIRRYKPCEASGLRLICFPHAGGAASYFFWLAQALAPHIEVLALQYPGRQDRRREKCVDNIPELVDRVGNALRGSIDGPFAFFGHSMGAVVAFEVTRRLQADSAGLPLRLFVSGRRAPSCRRTEAIHKRGDVALIEEVRRLGGTDPRILGDEEVLAGMLSLIRTDYMAAETYVYDPGPPLECPLTVLAGDNDPHATPAEVSAWRDFSTAEVDVRVFAGGHFYLTEYKPQVAEIITSSLGCQQLPRPS